MNILLLCVPFLIFDATCAPTDMEDGYETTENAQLVEGGERKLADTQSNEKNPVQEWFENLSKNTSTNAQNAFNTFKEWISKVSNNPVGGSASSNLPTMYMGSFQLIKMPMPQFGDVIKGMGDLATMAQGFNKLTGGGGGLLIPGIQGIQQG